MHTPGTKNDPSFNWSLEEFHGKVAIHESDTHPLLNGKSYFQSNQANSQSDGSDTEPEVPQAPRSTCFFSASLDGFHKSLQRFCYDFMDFHMASNKDNLTCVDFWPGPVDDDISFTVCL